MGQYVYSLVAASLFVTVVVSMLPEGVGTKYKRFVAFMGALVITLTIVSPLSVLLKKEIQIEKNKYDQTEKSEEDYARYYAQSAGMALYEIYGTDISKISARVTCSENGEIEEIQLNVNDSVIYSTKEAGEVLSEIYDLKISVKEEG